MPQNRKSLVILDAISQTRAMDEDERTRPTRRARDRDALVGVRQLRDAIPRLPLAGRGEDGARADRRRGARPPADGLLPLGRTPHPLGRGRRLRGARDGTPKRRASGWARSTRTCSGPTSTGSAASATRTPASARGRSSTAASASRSRTRSARRAEPLARRRHQLPGPGRPRGRDSRGSSKGWSSSTPSSPTG